MTQLQAHEPKKRRSLLGCFAGLIFVAALGILAVISGYLERPPWRHGWLPFVREWKPRDPAAGASTLELPHRFRSDRFYYLGDFSQNSVFLLRIEDGRFLDHLPDNRCAATVIAIRESVLVVYFDPRTERFAFDADFPEFKRGRVRQLQFVSALPGNSLAARAMALASSSAGHPGDIVQGRKSKWVFVDTKGNGKSLESYHAEAAVRSDEESGCRYFRLLVVSEDRALLTIDGRSRNAVVQWEDPFGAPVGEMEERPMKKGDVPSVIWKLKEENAFE